MMDVERNTGQFLVKDPTGTPSKEKSNKLELQALTERRNLPCVRTV